EVDVQRLQVRLGVADRSRPDADNRKVGHLHVELGLVRRIVNVQGRVIGRIGDVDGALNAQHAAGVADVDGVRAAADDGQLRAEIGVGAQVFDVYRVEAAAQFYSDVRDESWIEAGDFAVEIDHHAAGRGAVDGVDGELIRVIGAELIAIDFEVIGVGP